MPYKKKSVAVLAALIIMINFISYAQGAAIDFTGVIGGFTDNLGRVLGWEFTVGPRDILVNQLGVYDDGQNGLQVAHPIAIYDYQTETAVVSGTVPAGTSGVLSGFFRYVSTTPTRLKANTAYVIAVSWPAWVDQWLWYPADGYPSATVTGFTVDPAISLGLLGNPPKTRVVVGSTDLQFPPVWGQDGREVWIGPNFTFNPVPAPAPSLLLLDDK